ncbi:hypothetical protein K1719_002994 [Acacia pycnantha]|nr:hypothetical protein K1719_002994 [Acacia pycnantha]
MITDIAAVTSSHMMNIEASTIQENATVEELQKILAPGQPQSPAQHSQRFQGFLDLAQQLHIHLNPATALEQMPTYVNFLKDTLSRLGRHEAIPLSPNCSTWLLPGVHDDLRTSNSAPICYSTSICMTTATSLSPCMSLHLYTAAYSLIHSAAHFQFPADHLVQEGVSISSFFPPFIPYIGIMIVGTTLFTTLHQPSPRHGPFNNPTPARPVSSASKTSPLTSVVTHTLPMPNCPPPPSISPSSSDTPMSLSPEDSPDDPAWNRLLASRIASVSPPCLETTAPSAHPPNLPPQADLPTWIIPPSTSVTAGTPIPPDHGVVLSMAHCLFDCHSTSAARLLF